MALNIIEKLRQKPKVVRDNIALGIAGSVTSLVLIAWFVTSTDQLGEVVESSKQGASAFSTFINHAKNEVTSVVESLPAKEELLEAASSSLQTSVSNQITSPQIVPAEVENRPIIRIATTSASTTATSRNSI